jgi:microsomal epoxide hydrolase
MYKKPQADSYYQRLIAESLKTPTNTAVELLILSHRDWTSVLPKLAETPVLFAVTQPIAKQIDVVRAAMPNLQSEVFEDAGHALFVDDAERFNSTLQQFLDGSRAK